MKSNELSRTDLKAITSYKDKWLKAMCESGIKPGYISTALAFTFYINTDVTNNMFGLAWPTYPQLQKYSNIGNDTTKTNINDMIEDGWLVVEGMHNSGHRTISLAMGTSNVMLKPQKSVSKKSKDNLRQFTVGAYQPKYSIPANSSVPKDSVLSTDSSGVAAPKDSVLSTDTFGLKRTIEENYEREIDNRSTVAGANASLTSIENTFSNEDKDKEVFANAQTQEDSSFNTEDNSLTSIEDSFSNTEEKLIPVPKLSALDNQGCGNIPQGTNKAFEVKTEPVTVAFVESNNRYELPLKIREAGGVRDASNDRAWELVLVKWAYARPEQQIYSVNEIMGVSITEGLTIDQAATSLKYDVDAKAIDNNKPVSFDW